MKLKSIALSTDAGIEAVEKMLGVDNIYTEKGIKYVHHLETAVRAKAIYTRDKEYVVRDGEVVIVDEFTGTSAAWTALVRWSSIRQLRQKKVLLSNVSLKPLLQSPTKITSACTRSFRV
jgi:thymidylate kinase